MKTLLIALALFFCCGNVSGQTVDLQSSHQMVSHEALSFKPMDIMTSPQKLMRLWTDEAKPLPFYSDQEKEVQKLINKKAAEVIITYSPLDQEKEWMKVDYEEITPYTWKWIDLKLPKKDGTLTLINLRRPNWWLKEMGADQVGKTIYLNMPELGSQGWATVTAIRANQVDTRFWNENRRGDYVSRPITGKFEHESNDVYHLHFVDSKEPLGVTGSHPIWSIDRNDWIEAIALKEGEKVKTHAGELTLQSKEKRAGIHKVYNLEVFKDHNFLVSTHKILVHNTCFGRQSVTQFTLTHGDDLITRGQGYKKISSMTDDELIESVLKPNDGEFIIVNMQTGKVIQGNTRLYELKRRGIDIEVPFEKYNRNDSDYFFDL